MKKLKFLALLLCIILALSACTGTGSQGDKDDSSSENITGGVTDADNDVIVKPNGSGSNTDKDNNNSTDKTPGTNNSNPGNSTNNSDKDDEKLIFDIVDTPNEVRAEALDLKLGEKVLKRSIVNQGNTVRLANVIKKAMQGDKVTIGFIGGSITEGSSADSNKNFATLFKKWWAETFPFSRTVYVNAGKGSTDSLMGVHRIDDELLSQNPDIIIVDYGVNDKAKGDAEKEKLYKETYESLFRKILKKNNNTAIIAISMFDETGWSLQDIHTSVCKHYDIPMISYKNAIWPEGGTKVYKWFELSGDEVHPNNTGHAIISELLIYYVNTVRAQLTKIPTAVPKIPSKLTDASFENGVLYTNKNITPTSLGSFKKDDNAFWQFKNGWSVSGGKNAITFEVTGKNIYILYRVQNSNANAGTVSVKLDGKDVGTMDSNSMGSWGDRAEMFKVLDSSSSGKHTISIQLTEKTDFAILGIMVS